MKIGVVGTGMIACEVLPLLSGTGWKPSAICGTERSAPKLAELGEKYGAKTYTDYGTFLKSGNFDTVYLAVPNDLHFEFASRALSAGKHVIAEKPLAACYAEPIRIITVDPSIQTVGDLRGKTVALGEKGSLIYYNALDILGVYGLTEADITPVYAAPADAVSAVKNGDYDTAFLPGSTALWNSARLYELSYSLVAMDEAHVDLLIAAKPYYTKAYDESGQPCSVSVPTLLLARNDVVEEDVQNILSVILDESVMAPMCVYSLEAQQLLRPGFAGGFTALPYHPGAVAYFSEH